MRRVFLGLLFAVFLCGCAGSDHLSESGKLSKEEQAAVISHIRTFVARSKIKLTPAELAYMKTHEPIFTVSYTGYKEGALTVRWAFPRQRNLIVTRSGRLLSSDRADWTVRVTTDKSTQLVPQDFFGANGEELALPPL